MAETTATKREIGDPIEALSHFFILATTQDHSAAKVAACMLLGLYNGQRGRGGKWLFYVFYPAHLLLLWLVGQALGLSWGL